jgi:APA family basic amino acid/polyamine antiporter
LKLSPLIILSLVGLVIIDPMENFTPFNPSGDSMITAFGAASILTVWAFMGLEAAAIPAEDVIEPKKTIPKALVFGTLTAGIVYFASTYAVFGIVPIEQLLLSTAPFADAAVILVGQWGGVVLGIGAIISIVGSLNSNVICGAYTAMAAARDNLMPHSLAKMSKNKVPAASIILMGILGSVTMLLNFSKGLVAAYVFMILISTLSTLLAYALSSISSLVIEIRDPKMAGKERLRHMAIAFMAFVFSVVLIAAAGPEPVYWGFLLLLSGLPVYVWASRNKKTSEH